MQIEKISPDTVTFQITMTHAEQRHLLMVLKIANITVPETLQRNGNISLAQEKALMKLMEEIGTALTEL